MILIGAHRLGKSFTSRPLFEELTFAIEGGERVGLIGPNGAGKSTLLRILAGQLPPDQGTLSIQRGLRVGFLEQVPRFSEGSTVEATVLEGHHDPHEWEAMALAQEIMAKLDLSQFESHQTVASLSGGWKKRVALARELVRQPDLLLLDEPTNHLDIESILWLEAFLANSNFATLTITHDRLFLQRVANRIVELDRRHTNGLLSVKGDYAHFLDVRESLLAAQERQETKLRNTLRRETEWLRRGAQARQTKQQARIQGAQELAETVGELAERNRKATVRLDFQSTEKKPKKLVEAKGITKSYGGRQIVPPLDLVITPKSRIGLAGANGSGKSTLIKLLTKTEKPDAGTVVHADQLRISYFEQNRESLDPKISVLRTLCPLGDSVQFAGKMVHVKSYLARFLFSYEQMDLAVSKLSGGEQARLLLARLMLSEANLLVLDEPTNDLDMATLDVLAEVLQEFDGAILLVTHDRYFLDQMTNQILAFDVDGKGNKQITSMVGLAQWETWHQEQRVRPKVASALASINTSGSTGMSGDGTPPKKTKLSYKEQRELDGIEEVIQKAEEHLVRLTEESAKPENASNAQRLLELSREMTLAQAEIDRLYGRWAELSSR